MNDLSYAQIVDRLTQLNPGNLGEIRAALRVATASLVDNIEKRTSALVPTALDFSKAVKCVNELVSTNETLTKATVDVEKLYVAAARVLSRIEKQIKKLPTLGETTA